MKIGETVYAAVYDNGEIAGTQEGDLISSEKSELKFMIDAWRIPKDQVKIKKVMIVECK